MIEANPSLGEYFAQGSPHPKYVLHPARSRPSSESRRALGAEG